MEFIAVAYAPLVFQKDKTLSGAVAETVFAMQKQLKDTSTVTLQPWTRAYTLATQNLNTAIFPIVRTPERESLFKWVGPLFSEGDYFFKYKEAPLSIDTLEDAKQVARIAVKENTYPHLYLRAKGFTNLDIGPSYEANYKKLVSRRVNLVFLGEKTYRYMVASQGLDPSQFVRTNYRIATSSAWLAFTPDVPDAVIAKWQNAFNRIKRNGLHKAILQRYFSP